MKTAYELAMERLSKQSPVVTLTEEQKKRLAALDAEYKAKIADRELFLKGEMVKAIEKQDFEAMEQLEKQFTDARKTLQEELEQKREEVRKGK